MKRGVEHSNVGSLRQALAAGLVTFKVVGIVQRRQVVAGLNSQERRIVDHDGPVEISSPVHHAMPHALNVVRVFQDAMCRKPGKDSIQRRSVIWRRHRFAFRRICPRAR